MHSSDSYVWTTCNSPAKMRRMTRAELVEPTRAVNHRADRVASRHLLVVAQRLRHMHAHLAGAVSGVELGDALEELRTRNGGVRQGVYSRFFARSSSNCSTCRRIA